MLKCFKVPADRLAPVVDSYFCWPLVDHILLDIIVGIIIGTSQIKAKQLH